MRRDSSCILIVGLLLLFLAAGGGWIVGLLSMFSPDTLVSREEQCKNQAENFNYSLQKTIDEHGKDWPVKLVVVTCTEKE